MEFTRTSTADGSSITWWREYDSVALHLECDEHGSWREVERRFVAYLNDRSVLCGEDISVLDLASGGEDPVDISEFGCLRPEGLDEVVDALRHTARMNIDEGPLLDRILGFLACA